MEGDKRMSMMPKHKKKQMEKKCSIQNHNLYDKNTQL